MVFMQTGSEDPKAEEGVKVTVCSLLFSQLAERKTR